MCPWYPVLGNHDHRGKAAAEIEYSSLSSRWSMPAPYYRRTEVLSGEMIAEFFFLDTTPLTGIYDSKWASVFSREAETQCEWLATALSASPAKWKIVVGHHPIFSGGPHVVSGLLVDRIKPLLDRFHVAAYINGHDHNLQRIVVDNVNYLTCGSGCETRPTSPTNATLFEAAELGFLQVRILPAEIEVEFTDASNRSLHRATLT
jgi:acid phosphatase